jgi:hypothetical protein
LQAGRARETPPRSPGIALFVYFFHQLHPLAYAKSAFVAVEYKLQPKSPALGSLELLPTDAGDFPFMLNRNPMCSRIGLLAAAASLLAAAPALAQTETLYKLDTKCRIKGGEPQACVVEAVNEGNATLYRHSIGKKVKTIRVTDSPVRMSLWVESQKSWKNLDSAAARFSTNTICFNGRDLCVINPNYLNSIKEDRPDATAGRDLIKVQFGADGRIDLTCYDDGCKGIGK